MSGGSAHQSGPIGEELTNAALVALAELSSLAFVLRAAGTIGRIPDGRSPAVGWYRRWHRRPGRPADPATALGAPGLGTIA